jgi:hypothetical protein
VHHFDTDYSQNIKAAQSSIEALYHRGLAKVNSAGRIVQVDKASVRVPSLT